MVFVAEAFFFHRASVALSLERQRPLAKPSASERISDNLVTITPRGENRLRTRTMENEFSVAVDCATLQNIITSPPA
jgi:hypothetical protein